MPDQERSAATHVFHRHLHQVPPKAVSATGMFIQDAAGNQYIDASGGAAVSCLGHGHPDVLAAIHAQTDRLPYAHTSFFTSEPAEALAEQLIRTAMRRGLMVYPMGGTVDGQRGDHVLLAPPFIATEDHLTMMAARLHEAIDAAIATV